MKRIAWMALVAGCAMLARAEWVWWDVDFTEASVPWKTAAETPVTAWLTIIQTTTDETTKETKKEVVSGITSTTEFGDGDTLQQTFSFDDELNGFKTQLSGDVVSRLTGTDSSQYLIYVELGNSSGSPLWLSSGMTYDQLRSQKAISGDVGTIADAMVTPWAAGGWTATPEPCSGMLLVLGGALLALRRRRAV